MSRQYIGDPVNRLEDSRLLAGTACFVDDLKLPNMASMAVFRSPHGHARINRIDLSEVRDMDGVIDAFCAADVEG